MRVEVMVATCCGCYCHLQFVIAVMWPLKLDCPVVGDPLVTAFMVLICLIMLLLLS